VEEVPIIVISALGGGHCAFISDVAKLAKITHMTTSKAFLLRKLLFKKAISDGTFKSSIHFL
jgi:hypothetical protein